MSFSLRELVIDKSADRGCRPGAGVAPGCGRSSNRSLETVEPVSPQPKRKSENGLRRPAPKTRAKGPKCQKFLTGDRRPSA
jgi:hypothetical protein